MTNVQLFYKNDSSITIENLSSIEVARPGKEYHLDKDDFEMLQLDPTIPYIFAGDKESISVFGADLLYVRFVRA